MDRSKGANFLRLGRKIFVFFAVATLSSLRETYGIKNILACVKNDHKGVHREIWDDLKEPTLTALKNDSRYPNNPTFTEFIWNLDAPRGRGDNYGQRLLAYFIAAETGNYTFYMACDDECELYMSPNERRQNAYLLMTLTRRTSYRKWDEFGDEQKSKVIPLTRDHVYFIAAVMTNSRGMGHLSVGQRLPSGRMDRPIANKYLIRYAPGLYGDAPPGEWESWTPCSASCGPGTQTRNRTCIDPPPVYTGPSTSVNMTNIRQCNSQFSCPEPPQRVMGYNTSSTSLFVSWLPVNDNWPQGRVVGYRVLYTPRNMVRNREIDTTGVSKINTIGVSKMNTTGVSKMNITDVSKMNITGVSEMNTTGVSVFLKGLQKFTSYCIRVGAIVNFSFHGPLSACVYISTDEDVPSFPPAITEVRNISSTCIQVAWRKMPIEYAHGTVLGYNVQFRQRKAHAPSFYTTVPSDRLSVHLRGLQPFTEYCIKVSAYTKKGDGESGNCFFASTDETVPSSPPLSVSAQNRTSPEGVMVHWDAVPRNHQLGVIRGYKLRVRHIAEGYDDIKHPVDRIVSSDNSSREMFIGGLETFSRYTVEVAAFTRRGVGPFSEPVIVETCKCPSYFYTNWLPSPQYIQPAVNNTSAMPVGLFPSLINNMVRKVCGVCHRNRTTKVIYTSNGKPNGTSQKRSLMEVMADITSPAHFSFPISASMEHFINTKEKMFVSFVSDVTGIAYMTKKKGADVYAKVLGSSVFKCWPLLVIIIVLNLLAGLIIWVLDLSTNSEHFPTLFTKGAVEGVWCAFITMTTVGYGDRFPKSLLARSFAITWFLVGIVVLTLFVSEVASSLTVFSYNEVTNPERGTKFGVILGSMEYKHSRTMCSRPSISCEAYETMKDVFEALKSATINGIIVDVFTASHYKKEFENLDIQVRKVVNLPFVCGAVVVGDAAKVATEFNEFIRNHSNTIQAKLKSLYDSAESTSEEDSSKQKFANKNRAGKEDQEERMKEEQINFFDPRNNIYQSTLITCSASLGLAIVCGVIYQCYCFRKLFIQRRKQATKVVISFTRQITPEEMKQEMRKLLNHFYRNFIFIYLSLKRKHKLQLQELARLRQPQTRNWCQKSTLPLVRKRSKKYNFKEQAMNYEVVSLQWRPKDLNPM